MMGARVVIIPHARPARWLDMAAQHQRAAEAEKQASGYTDRFRAFNWKALEARRWARNLAHLERVVAAVNADLDKPPGPSVDLAKAPTIGAKMSPDRRTVWFSCPHCHRRHTHGAEGVVDGSNPHRLAHCTGADSPFHATGYFLVVVSDA